MRETERSDSDKHGDKHHPTRHQDDRSSDAHKEHLHQAYKMIFDEVYPGPRQDRHLNGKPLHEKPGEIPVLPAGTMTNGKSASDPELAALRGNLSNSTAEFQGIMTGKHGDARPLSGSAVAVAKQGNSLYLLTDAHNVEPEKGQKFQGGRIVLNGQPYESTKVVAKDLSNDLAMLKVDMSPEQIAKYQPIAVSSNPERDLAKGSHVITAGFGEASETLYLSQGEKVKGIAKENSAGEGEALKGEDPNRKMIFTNGDTPSGASGGPVVLNSERGPLLVGLADNSIRSKRNPMSMHTIVSQETVNGLLAKAGVSPDKEKSTVPESDKEQAKSPVPESDKEQAKSPVPESDKEQAKSPVPESDKEQAKSPVPESDKEQAKSPVPESDKEQAKSPVPESDKEQAKSPVLESDKEQAKSPVPESDKEHAKSPVPESDKEHAKSPVPESDKEHAKSPVPESDKEHAKSPVPESDKEHAKSPVPESDKEQRKSKIKAEEHQHSVVQGDNLWKIAAATIESSTGKHASAKETQSYVQEIIKRNESKYASLRKHPDRILAGMKFELPQLTIVGDDKVSK